MTYQAAAESPFHGHAVTLEGGNRSSINSARETFIKLAHAIQGCYPWSVIPRSARAAETNAKFKKKLHFVTIHLPWIIKKYIE